MKNKIIKKNRKLILLILLFVYLLTRLFFLFSINLFNEEECRVGTITKELIIGPHFPLFDFLSIFSTHYTGRLFEGFLAVPFYFLFGESGISVKLMFLTFSLGILYLVYLFLDRFFSRRAAIICALLMIFSIPVYTLSTLSQGGPHIESVFFDILIMFLFYNIFFYNKHNIKSFVLFGLVSGFAIFVNLTSLVMIFTCLLFWFIFDKKFFFKRNFFLFLSSLFLGSIPWIYYNITHSLRGLYFSTGNKSLFLKVFGNEISIDKIIQIIVKFKNFTFGIPKSFMFMDSTFFSKNFLSSVYFLLFFCSFIFVIYYCRKSILKLIQGIIPSEKFNVKPNEIKKETFILVYPIIFSIIYIISDFNICFGSLSANQYRHIVILYVFMFIIISLFLTRLWTERTKILSVFLLIILILLGLVGNLSFVSLGSIGEEIVYRSSCYDQLGQESLEQCHSLIEPYKSLCFAGYAKFIKYREEGSKISKIIESCNKIDEKYRYFCYEGLGQIIYQKSEGKINYLILGCNKVDENYKPSCYKGIGRSYGSRSTKNYRFYPFYNMINESYKNYYFEGFGQGIGQFFGAIPTQAIGQCNKIDKEYRHYCFKGLGWSLAEKFSDNPTGAGKFSKYVDEEYSDYFYKGIGSYIGLMFGYNITKAKEECEKLKDNLHCLEGMYSYFSDNGYI